jgi:hypothetical protein
MKSTTFKVLFEPRLQNPVLIVGLPGLGDVGRLVAKMLIDAERAELFAELYSPFFPDLAIVERGICRLPRYEFWSCPIAKPNLIVLTGDYQPSPAEIPAHYGVCGSVLEFVREYGCRIVITLGGLRTSPGRRGVIFVTANSKSLVKKLSEKGYHIYRGRIIGASGLFLGIAKIYRMIGACILGGTAGDVPDQVAASKVYDFLKTVLTEGVIA